MIDVLNKHFQDSLHITKAESAFVQFANYMGYFFMAIPSGLLAIRFGYKGAIIIGLALVAMGSFWFIPAVHIGTYWSFLLGLFILAAGLTCLETVANPYTTVLGPPGSGPARINLAQSANGIGWMIGPVLGGFFVLSATGEPITSSADLYKPYLIVAVIVAVIAFIFIVSKIPDLHNIEESKVESAGGKVSVKPLWKRRHFVLAVAAQFFYVAAQTGVFSFFVNYVDSETPVLSQAGANRLQAYGDGLHTVFRIPATQMTYPAAMFSGGDIKDLSGFTAKLQNDSDSKSQPVSKFIWSQISSSEDYTSATIDQQKKAVVVKILNQILQADSLFKFRSQTDTTATGEQLVRLNRKFLEDTYPPELIARSPNLDSPQFKITDRGAGTLLSFGGFALFLLGRITGSLALRAFKPHLMLALYSVANVVMMVLTMNAWGWWSVFGLFMSFFFMSITYPTIFSLGIHGLGEKTKIGSSFIVQAIVGGAIMPLWMGWLADHYGMRIGFLMPLLCFIFIAGYGLFWEKLEAKDAAK
jgi:fucose permease